MPRSFAADLGPQAFGTAKAAEARTVRKYDFQLEPISKLPEEDNEASKLNKTQKVLGVKFPSNEDATLPLYPSEEALDQPASLVSSQAPPILGSHFSVGSVSLDHVEVEAELNQTHFVVVGSVRADRQRQSVTIDYRHDFQAFSAPSRPDLSSTSFGHRKCRVDKAFLLVQPTAVPQLVGDIRQNVPQRLVTAPRLKTPMHCLVVRIALRKHVPLRPRVEDPEGCLQHATRRDRLTAGTVISNVLFRKTIPDAIPLLVRQAIHPFVIADRHPSAILR